jgi:hypothetical protein
VEFGQVQPWTLPPSLFLPLLTPSSPHHPTALALTQYYILRYIYSIYHHSLSPLAVWTTQDDAEADSPFLPTPGHIAASVSTYIPSIHLLLIFYCVLHAPPPPQHGFFQPSTWWVIMVSPPASYLFLLIADWFWWVLVGFLVLSTGGFFFYCPAGKCWPHFMLYSCACLLLASSNILVLPLHLFPA